MPSVSVITPTIGRASLKVMLGRLLPQLGPRDEILLVGDGPQPQARAIVKELASPLIRYWEYGPSMNYGNPQRNNALLQAKCDYLVYVDDDDVPEPDAIATIRKAALEAPGRPLMFKMYHCGQVLWRKKVIEGANVSGQMFVAPNVDDMVGKWSGRYEADLDYMRRTVRTYPGKDEAVVWREEIICTQGYVGRQSIAHETDKKEA